MNKPKIIYWVSNGQITELNFVCDYPGRTETSIWKAPNGTLIKFQNEVFEMEKHVYFENIDDATKQLIRWHKDRITILEHNLKQKECTH